MLHPASTSPTPTLSSGVSAGLVAGVAISVAAAVAMAVTLIVMYLCLRKDKMADVEELKGHLCSPQQKNWQLHPSPPSRPPSSPIINGRGSCGFNYLESGKMLGPARSSIPLELAMATDEFSGGNLIGQDKEVLSNGKEMEMKQLKAGIEQGDGEFQAEVLQDLVRHCITGFPTLSVRQFVPNNKLEFHLHGNSKIIHPEIKAPNLLLDHKLESKVADFGLAKLSCNVNTHVSTRVKGTIGCGASKYPSSGCLEAYKRLNWTKFQSQYIAWAYKIQAQNLPKTQFPNFFNIRKLRNYPNFSSAATISTASAGAFLQKPPRNYPPLQSPPPLTEFLRKNLPEFFCRHNLHHLLRLHRKTYPKILRRHNSHRLRRSPSISSIQLRQIRYVNPNRNSAAMARALRFVRVLPPCKFLRL